MLNEMKSRKTRNESKSLTVKPGSSSSHLLPVIVFLLLLMTGLQASYANDGERCGKLQDRSELLDDATLMKQQDTDEVSAIVFNMGETDETVLKATGQDETKLDNGDEELVVFFKSQDGDKTMKFVRTTDGKTGEKQTWLYERV